MPPLLILYLTFLKRPDAILIPHNWWGQYITTWCTRLQNRRELWNSFGIVGCIQCCQIIQRLCMHQFKILSVCSCSCITATTFLEYFYPRPCKWNAVTWQPQLSPSPLLLTMGWAKHSTIEVWRHCVLGEGRGWWGYWWNMLASGYTLHNNNIVHTHTAAGHSGGWHI